MFKADGKIINKQTHLKITPGDIRLIMVWQQESTEKNHGFITPTRKVV